ncbi:2-oxoglutarate dehydrogenase, mitochondrial-like protein [Tanacetum coccineum]
MVAAAMSVVYVFTTPILEDGGDDLTVEQVRNRAKYMADDASSKKFLVSNFTNYKITDSRPVMEQHNELFGILGRFTQHKMNMDEAIQISCIIDKLPPSWKDFKHTLKHKKEELTLVELGSHLRIEVSLRAHDSDKPKGHNVVGPQNNLVSSGVLNNCGYNQANIVNNIVAFTTDPQAGRSSQYCTDVAKALDAPIFHVNGDDVEAVAHACELAAEWRQTFHSDVVVDIVCYCGFGHNEIDEPSFTQPKMYKIIRNHPSSLEIYPKKLLESGLATKENIDAIQNKVTTILNEEFLASKDYVPQRRDWLSAYWTGFKSPEQLSRIRNTGVKPEILKNMSDDNPFVIPEMEPTLRNQSQTCNWQVVNVTTPANYFHVLRQQLHREFRKPLIVMAPKNFLRHKDCKSNLSEFDDVQGHPGFDKQGTRFKRLIKDRNDHSDLEEGIRRLVLCSGKVYYELDEQRKSGEGTDIAICRVEQLCPFPYDLIQRELKRYPSKFRHSNRRAKCRSCLVPGGASYITAMKALDRGTIDDIKYVGRAPAAATATGFYTVHTREQTELVQKALQQETLPNPALC